MRAMLLGGCAVALVACTNDAMETAGKAKSWGYEGETGPLNWAGLSPAFAACGGEAQSPVDIVVGEVVPASLERVQIDYDPFAPNVVNVGKTVLVEAPEGAGTVTLGDTRYGLVQFHFHRASEHTIDGEAAPMEVHFVNAADDGRLLVLGALIRPGAENAALEPVLTAVPTEEGESRPLETTIDPMALLPASAEAYRYRGSLTTPPCDEIVTWHVFAEPVAVSAGQIATYRGAFPPSARPTQPLNQRRLLTNAGRT